MDAGQKSADSLGAGSWHDDCSSGLASCVVLCCAVACVVCAPQVRNEKPRTKEEQGQQKRQESLIHHSNVMHYSTTQQVCTGRGCLSV